MNGLLIDNFAGGGGASTGIEAALGRPVDIAINHDQSAIAVHSANHPHTRHYCQSIYSVDPLEVTGGEPVLLAWFSPDCKHHSKAKGGKPREKYIRDMAHVVPHWIERLMKASPKGNGLKQRSDRPEKSGAPQVIILENVEEFRQWGPLDEHGKPIPERKGEEFDLWVRRIRKAGYKVEWRELRACDYGAPTTRKRLFLIARRDGLPIVWPKPTHFSPAQLAAHPDGHPWRTAAECIDWSLPCPSILDRARPLKTATCRRIAAGVMRHVVNSARPFIVPLPHHGAADRSYSLDAPIPTITAAHRGEMALVAPVFARTAHGEQDKSGKKRGRGDHTVTDPFPTVTASGLHHGVAAVLLEKFSENSRGCAIDEPMHTVMAGAPRHAQVAAFLAQHNTERGDRSNPGRAADSPISTITGRGTQQQAVQVTLIDAGVLPAELLHRAELVAAFLVKYYGSEQGQHQAVDVPIDVITAKARFAVVTVTIAGDSFVLVDIGMRMLTPRELANAQGFPPGYVLDPECWYKTDGGNLKFGRLPKSHQIARIGNAVCPPMSEALCRANLAEAVRESEAA